MTVSLIISTYNSPKALDLCLMSVLQQSVLPDEVLIADDGSNEETRKIVEEFKKQSTVPVIHVPCRYESLLWFCHLQMCD